MASRSLADLHPDLAAAYKRAEADWLTLYPTAPRPVVTCTCRPGAEQNQLFNQPHDGRDNDGDGKVDESDEKVTQAKAGQSPHNYRPAFALDVAFTANGRTDWSPHWFQKFAALMKKTPNVAWGGDWVGFKDLPHFELKDWRVRAKTAAVA